MFCQPKPCVCPMQLNNEIKTPVGRNHKVSYSVLLSLLKNFFYHYEMVGVLGVEAERHFMMST